MSNKECIICYNPIIKNKKFVVDIYGNCDCSDKFVQETCSQCIDKWVDLNQTCIFCRKHMFIYRETFTEKCMKYVYLFEVALFLYIVIV